MKQTIFLLISLLIICSPSIAGDTGLKGFVFIKGGIFRSGDILTDSVRNNVRLDDFEMLDHPVTNAEYKKFTDATGYQPPLHWINGQIPEEKDDYPVIFVNRTDVEHYLNWISGEEGRIYRLPTTVEFEYASRGGLIDKKYPWGDSSPEGKANYDEKANRRFDRWQDYLQPASSNKPNDYGLYNMAGNIWHLTINLLDPAVTPFKYRITDVPTLEGSRMGGFLGSWTGIPALRQPVGIVVWYSASRPGISSGTPARRCRLAHSAPKIVRCFVWKRTGFYQLGSSEK